MKKYKVLFAFLVITLTFIQCSRKGSEGVSSPPAEETGEVKKSLTLEEYLTLPVWETEREAFSLLSRASEMKDLQEMNGLYLDAVKLFEEVGNYIEDLELSIDEEKLNKLQKEICGIYVTVLNGYLETKDPKEMDKLKDADEKMKEFIEELEKAGSK